MPEPAILVDNLTKLFGSFVAVDHVSFEIQTGEIVGFVGPNGSGKTTTIRMLLGLLSPSDGTGNRARLRQLPRIGTGPRALRVHVAEVRHL